MNTCPYCATELELMQSGPYKDHAYCDFCQVILGPESEHGMYEKDNIRANKKRLNLVTLEAAQAPIPDMKNYHTADLIQLLKLARKERAEQYNLLRVLNNAVKHGSQEFADPADEQGGNYLAWTRYCWRIENILKERIGYFPVKIMDDFIVKYEERCKASENKMESRKKRKQLVVNESK